MHLAPAGGRAAVTFRKDYMYIMHILREFINSLIAHATIAHLIVIVVFSVLLLLFKFAIDKNPPEKG